MPVHHLLQRRREGLRLTAAGSVLLEESRNVLSLIDHGLSQTRQAAGLGRPQLRMVFEAGETVQVAAKLEHGKRTVAKATFSPMAKGRRSLLWTLPAGTKLAGTTLALTIKDGFGNRSTVRRRIR